MAVGCCCPLPFPPLFALYYYYMHRKRLDPLEIFFLTIRGQGSHGEDLEDLFPNLTICFCCEKYPSPPLVLSSSASGAKRRRMVPDINFSRGIDYRHSRREPKKDCRHLCQVYSIKKESKVEIKFVSGLSGSSSSSSRWRAY